MRRALTLLAIPAAIMLMAPTEYPQSTLWIENAEPTRQVSGEPPPAPLEERIEPWLPWLGVALLGLAVVLVRRRR